MSLSPMDTVGKLFIFIGPMFSRKTTRLLAELSTCADVGYSTLYINHILDDRQTESSSETITTHSSQFKYLSPKIASVKVSQLSPLDITPYSIIGIDESQFFPDLVETVNCWVEKERKTVFVAGLDGDSFRQPMGQTLQLIPYADSVVKLTAHCRKCLLKSGELNLTPAPFTARLSSSKEQVLIGGSDTYIPLCRSCYLNYN